MQRRIFYTRLDSPWGPLFLAGTEKGVCRCTFMRDQDVTDILSQMTKGNPDAMVKGDMASVSSAVGLLKRYFSGQAELHRYPLDLQGSPFQLQVWSVLTEIPFGKVATYGEIAARIGRPRGARAVGQACGSNPVVLFVPCHRVVSSQGKLGGFGGGLDLKKSLLRHEGYFRGQQTASSRQQ